MQESERGLKGQGVTYKESKINRGRVKGEKTAGLSHSDNNTGGSRAPIKFHLFIRMYREL